MTGPPSTLWPLEAHTRGKHLVLERYLQAWFPILGSKWTRIVFIDGFAGPGEYQGGETGSPLIALNAFQEHRYRDKITGEVIFIFIETREDRSRHLERRIDALRASLPENCRVYVVSSTFDSQLTGILNHLDEQSRRLAPAFVMVDPFGVSGTPMSVLTRILANPQSELYVSFMYEAINRFKDTSEFAPHLDELFGTTEWRGGLSLEDRDERKDFYYGLYERQLRNADADQVVRFELYEGDRLVYAIFFATHSTKGTDRMKAAIWKVAPFGDFAFRGVRSQLGLDLTTADFTPLRTALKAEFAGKGLVSIEAIEDFVASDRTDYFTGQLRKQALVPMEKLGEIEVDGSTRKKRRTYPPGTMIQFL